MHLKIDTEQKMCQFMQKETESATKIQDLEEQVEQSSSKQKKKDVSSFLLRRDENPPWIQHLWIINEDERKFATANVIRKASFNISLFKKFSFV